MAPDPRIPARVPVRSYKPVRPLLDIRGGDRLALEGRVADRRTGLPLPGIVVALVPERGPAGASRDRTETRTDRRGHFALDPPDGRDTRWAVIAEDEAGDRVARTRLDPDAADGEILLEVDVPRRRPDRDRFAVMAERMEEAGVSLLSAAVRHLALVPSERSLFGDWDLGTRFGLIDALERGFVDPDGVLSGEGEEPDELPSLRSLQDGGVLGGLVRRAMGRDRSEPAGLRRAVEHVQGHTSLLEVDRPLALERLSDGNVTAAIADGWKDALSKADTLAAILRPGYYDKDLVAYRDYLRDRVAPDGSGDPNVERLEERFHQDFRTKVTGESPLNELLVALLEKILVASAGQEYGFGRDPSDIEPRGDRQARAYLDYLIDLAPVSRTELERRYRVHLDRPDSAMSSPVDLNITTLQGLLRDAPHSVADPHLKVPPESGSGAPFFLYYDEWLPRNQAFHPENHWNIERTFTSLVPDSYREQVMEQAPEGTQNEPNEGWFRLMLQAEDVLREANQDAERGEWGLAQLHYREAGELGREALVQSTKCKRARQLAGIGNDYNLGDHLANRFASLQSTTVTDEADLKGLAYRLLVRHHEKGYPLAPWFEHTPGYTFTSALDYFLLNRLQLLQFQLLRLNILIVPCRLGDVALAAGDYVGAMEQYARVSRFIFAKAESWDRPGTFAWGNWSGPPPAEWWPLLEGSLPWSGRRNGPEMGSLTGGLNWDKLYIDSASHPIERRMFRVRHGEAMVEWADALYRTAVDGKVQRARELYKGAFLVHGSSPPVSPQWQTGRRLLATGWKLTLRGSTNPAVVSQKNRARQGILKIDAGLDAYGTDDSVVPSLRYSTLKGAADRFAAAAQAAQSDLLLYLEQFEEGLKEELSSIHMLEKARVQAQIAGQQHEIARLHAKQAKLHLGTLEAQYDATYKELRALDSGLKPITDLFGGIIGGMLDAGKKPASVAFSGGSKASSVGGFWGGVGYAGSVVGFAAIYMYYGVTTIEAMEGTRDGLRAKMKALKEVAIPIAEAQVEVHQREARIAELQGESAELDAIHARNLLEFQQARLLSTDFWQDFTVLMRRALHRYLELGARAAWLAERALAFEQGRPLDIIRLDYFPKDKGYASGADLLALDLAELEAARLEGLEKALPIQRRVSLAFDFPAAFLALKQDGRCSFHMRDRPFVAAAPGTFGHRVRAVTVRPLTVPGTPPVHGLLSSDGVSSVRQEDDTYRTAVQEPDALPISEFQLREDMEVHGLPDQALMSFEGSGLNTTWTLELPPAGNPYGLGSLLDVELEIDARAFYSPTLHQADNDEPPAARPRMAVGTASKLWPDALAALQEATGPVQLTLSLEELPLPGEGNVGGLVLVILGPESYDGPAAVTIGSASATAQLTAGADGTRFAAEDAEEPVDPRPLDDLVGSSVAAEIVVEIDPGDFSGASLATVTDLLLGVLAE